MKIPKFKNIVWLELPIQQKVFELANKLGMANNVLMAELIRFILNDEEILNKFVSNFEIKEELPIKYFTKCPICNRRMELERIKTHVKIAHGLDIEEIKQEKTK